MVDRSGQITIALPPCLHGHQITSRGYTAWCTAVHVVPISAQTTLLGLLVWMAIVDKFAGTWLSVRVQMPTTETDGEHGCPELRATAVGFLPLPKPSHEAAGNFFVGALSLSRTQLVSYMYTTSCKYYCMLLTAALHAFCASQACPHVSVFFRPSHSPQDLVEPGQVILVGSVAPSRRVLGLVPSLVLLLVARHLGVALLLLTHGRR